MLTTAAGTQRDLIGHRQFHEGRYHAGVEPPGHRQQALWCIWELAARDVALWNALQRVFTSGLRRGREVEQGAIDTVRGHTTWKGCWGRALENIGEACMGLSGSRSKTHQDLHGVFGFDEPGHVGWTLQDEHGASIPRGASQIHLHSHRSGPAGKQTPASERAGMRGWAGPDGDWSSRDKAWGPRAAAALLLTGMRA